MYNENTNKVIELFKGTSRNQALPPLHKHSDKWRLNVHELTPFLQFKDPGFG